MWHDSVLFFIWFRSSTCKVRLLFDRRPRSRGWKILGVDGKGIGAERSWKLDNSHGHHMCIATYWSNRHCVKSVQIRTKKNSVFGHFWDSASRAKEKKNKNILFCDNFLHFQIFQTFENLVIYFSVNVSKS